MLLFPMIRLVPFQPEILEPLEKLSREYHCLGKHSSRRD